MIKLLKVLFTIVIVCMIGYGLYVVSLFFNYSIVLNRHEDEYINTFYQSSFSGIITYIKEYEKNPGKYVIGVTDSTKSERIIGKVEISNFSSVLEGDTVKKK